MALQLQLHNNQVLLDTMCIFQTGEKHKYFFKGQDMTADCQYQNIQ
jgi:hypothetical protein